MLNTHRRPSEARAVRVDQAQRDSQRRLADKSFTTFMRDHNARLTNQKGA